jgi:Putative viral replication protein
MVASKNWCFTLNNFTDTDVQRLDDLVATDNDVSYVLYGKETGESGIPKLEGLIVMKKRTHLSEVKRIIGSDPHLEIARRVNRRLSYCKKQGVEARRMAAIRVEDKRVETRWRALAEEASRVVESVKARQLSWDNENDEYVINSNLGGSDISFSCVG